MDCGASAKPFHKTVKHFRLKCCTCPSKPRNYVHTQTYVHASAVFLLGKRALQSLEVFMCLYKYNMYHLGLSKQWYVHYTCVLCTFLHMCVLSVDLPVKWSSPWCKHSRGKIRVLRWFNCFNQAKWSFICVGIHILTVEIISINPHHIILFIL